MAEAGRNRALASLLLGLASVPAIFVWLRVPGLVLAWLPLPLVAIGLGRAARRRLSETAADRRWHWAASSGIALSGLALLLGAQAFLALPTLLAGRVSENHTRALSDLRAVIAAEAAYNRANGVYGRLESLPLPRELVAEGLRNGYRFVLRLGKDSRSFAVLAVPETGANEESPFRPRTGHAALCGDARGWVCRAQDGAVPAIGDGRCPDSAAPQGASDVPACAAVTPR